MVLSRFLRMVQLFVFLYVSVAIVYTTNYFVVLPLNICLSKLLKTSIAPTPPRWLSLFLQSSPDFQVPPASAPWLPELSEEIILWNTSDFAIQHGVGSPDSQRMAMSEELFLSKAFSQSMRPSKIIPFFYRGSGNYDKEDITITTLVTSNRFKVFGQLVERYHGPISVTIHVKNTTSHITSLLSSLHELYTKTPGMSTTVDVHLVIDSFDRQFNTWRNIARLFSRTDYVMMLDVDFAIRTDFRSAMRQSKQLMDKLREGRAAFVVPAFEYVKHSEGTDQNTFPTDKETLRSLVKARRIGMFHPSWPAGHNSTDYPRYYSSTPGSVYKVNSYQSAYEPYVVFKKSSAPWCDERFVGYGGNKAACLFEMYLSGISFYVLSDHFIVHQNHAYEETARRNERKYNRRVYSDFKEEACLRYLKSYYDSGLLNTTRGYNVQDECKKIRGISRIAAQFIDGNG